MRHRLLVLFGALAAVIGVALVPVLVKAQTRKTPEQEPSTRKAPPFRPEALNWKQTFTPWGDPDLQGEWTGMTPTPLERLKPGENRITDPVELARRYDLDPEETGRGVGTYNAGWHEDGRELSYHPAFKGQTEKIVDPPDGRLPPRTPEAQKKAEARAALRNPDGSQPDSAGPEDRSVNERCIGWELAIGGIVSSWYRIVQTPGWVAINQYRMHDMRMIPLDGRPHLPQAVRAWQGDSRGHWEGNTLVVDTTNFNGKLGANLQGSDENLHLIERYTQIDADTIKYEYTVEDPTVWTRPWSISIPLAKDTDGFYEYACHEGNQAMTGMLSGARASEAKKAAAKPDSK
jgi:hypothetical protein